MSEPKNDATEQRNSVAQEPEIIRDPIQLAEAEAANGLRQYDLGKNIAQEAIDRMQSSTDYRFQLRLSTLLALHREALAGISQFAGNFRPSKVEISQSAHKPPEAHLVPSLVEDMCDYINANWHRSTPLHLAAYTMWRLNWIHPFADGNGRTSRITSYVILMVRAGFILPGSPTIPDQIVSDRRGYFSALDAADAAWIAGEVDVSAMEDLLSGMLARQLTAFYRSAGGKFNDGDDSG